MASSRSLPTTRVVIFDIRGASPRDSRFQAAAQALYETSLLAHAKCTPKFEYVSLVVIGSKGYQVLVEMQQLKHLDKSFKKSCIKLKQIMNFPTQETIYSSRGSLESILTDRVAQFRKKCTNTRLKMFILTSLDGHSIYKEVEQFLYKTDCILLKRILVAQLIPSGMNSIPIQGNGPLFNKVFKWCDLSAQSDDSVKFFKKWLFVQRKNWQISMASSKQWKITVNIEDVLVDPTLFWSTSVISGNLSVLHDGSQKLLEIFEFVRSDGISSTSVYGVPRRVFPTQQKDADESNLNRQHFFSLSSWLMNGNLAAIMHLLPCDKITDLFVLIPGSDGSMLLRNLVARELLLPPTVVEDTRMDAEMDAETDMPREAYYEEVHLACLQVPRQREYNSLAEKGDIYSAIEEKMAQEPVACKTVDREHQVVPLRLRNHR